MFNMIQPKLSFHDIAKFIGISNDGQKEFKAQQEKLDELAKKRKEENLAIDHKCDAFI